MGPSNMVANGPLVLDHHAAATLADQSLSVQLYLEHPKLTEPARAKSQRTCTVKVPPSLLFQCRITKGELELHSHAAQWRVQVASALFDVMDPLLADHQMQSSRRAAAFYSNFRAVVLTLLPDTNDSRARKLLRFSRDGEVVSAVDMRQICSTLIADLATVPSSIEELEAPDKPPPKVIRFGVCFADHEVIPTILEHPTLIPFVAADFPSAAAFAEFQAAQNQTTTTPASPQKPRVVTVSPDDDDDDDSYDDDDDVYENNNTDNGAAIDADAHVESAYQVSFVEPSIASEFARTQAVLDREVASIDEQEASLPNHGVSGDLHGHQLDFSSPDPNVSALRAELRAFERDTTSKLDATETRLLAAVERGLRSVIESVDSGHPTKSSKVPKKSPTASSKLKSPASTKRVSKVKSKPSTPLPKHRKSAVKPPKDSDSARLSVDAPGTHADTKSAPAKIVSAVLDDDVSVITGSVSHRSSADHKGFKAARKSARSVKSAVSSPLVEDIEFGRAGTFSYATPPLADNALARQFQSLLATKPPLDNIKLMDDRDRVLYYRKLPSIVSAPAITHGTLRASHSTDTSGGGSDSFHRLTVTGFLYPDGTGPGGGGDGYDPGSDYAALPHHERPLPMLWGIDWTRTHINPSDTLAPRDPVTGMAFPWLANPPGQDTQICHPVRLFTVDADVSGYAAKFWRPHETSPTKQNDFKKDFPRYTKTDNLTVHQALQIYLGRLETCCLKHKVFLPLLARLSHDDRLGPRWRVLPVHIAALVPTSFNDTLTELFRKDDKLLQAVPDMNGYDGCASAYQMFYVIARAAHHPLLSREGFDRLQQVPTMSQGDTFASYSVSWVHHLLRMGQLGWTLSDRFFFQAWVQGLVPGMRSVGRAFYASALNGRHRHDALLHMFQPSEIANSMCEFCHAQYQVSVRMLKGSSLTSALPIHRVTTASGTTPDFPVSHALPLNAVGAGGAGGAGRVRMRNRYDADGRPLCNKCGSPDHIARNCTAPAPADNPVAATVARLYQQYLDEREDLSDQDAYDTIEEFAVRSLQQHFR